MFGTIISEPNIKNYNTSYTLKVENINDNNYYKDTKILLYIKSNNLNLKYGDQICFKTELEDASTKRNEGGFDYRNYLKIKGIYKISTVKLKDIKVIKENNISLISRIVNETRNIIKENSKRILPENEANFLIGILIGDKSELDEQIQNNFRSSSLSHILAVSGMHVSYVIIGIYFIINKIKIGKNKGKYIIIILLIFFMLLIGSTPSVMRACIMAIYMIIGSLIHKKTNVINSICFSSIVILLINPYYICDIGFQLSYGGTIGIVFLYPIIRRKCIKKQNINENIKITIFEKVRIKIIEIIIATLSANIIIFPITLYHYNTVSTIFILSNLLVSPFIGIIILLGFLSIIICLICFPIAKIIAVVLKFFIDFIINIAGVIGSFTLSQIYFITPPIYLIIIYYFIIFFILFGKKLNFFNLKKTKKIISILLIIIILCNFIFIKIIPKDLKIYLIDVGQR